MATLPWPMQLGYRHLTIELRARVSHGSGRLIILVKLRDVIYTSWLDQRVLQSLIGSNDTDAAGQLGILAETVNTITRNHLADTTV